jgi:hypothetical protein
MTTILTPDPERPCLAQQLRNLAARFKDEQVTLADIIAVLQGRGFDLLLVVLSLPFLTPVPVPLLSMPFGAIIALVGLRLAFGKKPHIPKRLLHRPLPPRFFPRILTAASRLVSLLEWLTKPRLRLLNEHIVFQRVGGCIIAVSGMLLLLPVPVPFSNFFPAGAVLFIAAGALDRDGLFFLTGCAMFCLALAYFTLLPIGGYEVVTRLLAWRA